MALAPGTRLDHYEIVSAIGAGGMGEVYRAHDSKLDRDVAFKILPAAFAHDAERLARFAREAKLLASLNHPHIAQIYGIVEANGTRGIVMELVDGETLQARLLRGPLPLREALSIAREVADGLESAHDRGIVHRDLKPGNIMVTADGHAKVLDLGLAKVVEPAAADPELSHSPTVITGATMPNVLVGTAAYVSPEQVRGRVADERSDVWAFGCVLYEMLTGRQPFAGQTVTDLLGAIAHVEPNWDALPSNTPSTIRSLIKRCLEKERRRRIHSIGDVRIELEETPSAAPSPAVMPRRTSKLTAWIAVAVVLLAATVAAVWFTMRASPSAPAVATRFLVEFPADAGLGNAPADPFPTISPDGRYIVFRAGGAGFGGLWLRPVSSLTATTLVNGVGLQNVRGAHPFWSPDSRYIAFFQVGKLAKVAVTGGPPQALCDAAVVTGGSWSRNDVILFDDQGVIRRVSAAGGASIVVREPDKSRAEVALRWPSFLPDGQHFVYVANNVDLGRSEFRIGALDSKEDRSLMPGSSRIVYASNHLLFARSGALFAQPFDPRTLSLTGDAFPAIADQIAFGPEGSAAFDASGNGTLVYRELGQSTDTELTWFDRAGKQIGLAPVMGRVQLPNLASDQNRVVVTRNDNTGSDIWMLDLSRGTSSRFTYDPASDMFPVFSANGKQVAFASNRGGAWGIYVKASNGIGMEELLLKVDGVANLGIADWSPDGKVLLYNALTSGSWDAWAVPTMGDRKPVPILNGKYNEYRTRFSPDGRWFVYTSDETGRSEIYVQTYPPSGGKWQVSVDGGVDAYWRRDGKEIVFNSTDGRMMAVDVTLGQAFSAGVPHPLFKIPGPIVSVRFVVTADAQRFLLPMSARAAGRPTLTAVLNWTADLKK